MTSRADRFREAAEADMDMIVRCLQPPMRIDMARLYIRRFTWHIVQTMPDGNEWDEAMRIVYEMMEPNDPEVLDRQLREAAAKAKANG